MLGADWHGPAGTGAEALSNEWVDAAAIRRKQHFHCFAKYLGPAQDGLGAQTILEEEPYLSQSFLADYADYYARGFTAYLLLCEWVHFFRVAFDQATLDAALLDPHVGQEFWDSYLGYVVVKPLPARLGPRCCASILTRRLQCTG